MGPHRGHIRATNDQIAADTTVTIGPASAQLTDHVGRASPVTATCCDSLARRKPGPILSRLQAFGLWDLALGVRPPALNRQAR
jgi:hypothetical protein